MKAFVKGTLVVLLIIALLLVFVFLTTDSAPDDFNLEDWIAISLIILVFSAVIGGGFGIYISSWQWKPSQGQLESESLGDAPEINLNLKSFLQDWPRLKSEYPEDTWVLYISGLFNVAGSKDELDGYVYDLPVDYLLHEVHGNGSINITH